MHTILIVDDDITLRNAIVIFLKNRSFRVVSFDNVYEVLIFLYKDTVDLIIADIMMPELDGYDLLNILKNDVNYCIIPIILLTAKGITVDKVKGYNLGCNMYITKPFAPYELLSIIDNLLKINNPALQQDNIVKNNIIKENMKTLFSSFTYREKSILDLVIKGYTNKEIASSLQLSLRNVEKYVSRLLYKTNTRNRTELVNFILNF